jgi:hypothetical protein
MKRNYFLLISLCFLVLSGPLAAQSRLYFGANGSMLNTWTTNQMNYGYPDMDYQFTVNMGINANAGYDFNKSVGVLLQLGYAKLGQKYTDQINDTNYSRRVGMNYFQIPLMFRYRTSGEIARFYVMAGPQFNILLSAEQTYYKNDATPFDSVWNEKLNKPVLIGETDITDRFTTFDIMARVDMGVEITLIENLFLTAGLSMAYGLMDVNDEAWRYNNSDGVYNPSHNAYIGFSVGVNYCFDPKKGKKSN